MSAALPDTMPDPATLLDALREQGEMLAETPALALAEAVPTVPGWTVEDVVRHTAEVHRWVLTVLAAPVDAHLSRIPLGDTVPHGPDCLDAYRDDLDDLVDAFTNRDLAQPVRTLSGTGTVAWWLRRQTHEVSVHRIDVADTMKALGGPSVPALDATVAADGVDEWAHVFLPRLARAGRFPTLDGRSIHLHGTDTGHAEWHLVFAPDDVAVTREHRKGDVALRGRAQDLLLAVWRRRPLSRLETIGDVAIAETMLGAAAL
ncbi:maleylpyruvate isomerase N-terminal domain-containing protein [Prescottella subtropica]|uniref:maleylpyruvate isomerase N-terminal domain-containing protein n=1 Tax=Prescottella subtropica TaxID=2545757 RepID=UPI001F50092D|nr:maleylpyruvate isomerase N-terminal domain-containing protein [Prescottella subtropica]